MQIRKGACCWPIAILLFAFVSQGALSQTKVMEKAATRLNEAIEDLKARCSYDLKTFCPKVTPGEGRFAFCLKAHRDKISPQCEYALFDASRAIKETVRRLDEAVDFCWNDIEKLCANVVQGKGRIAQCLVDNKSKLSADCANVANRFMKH